MNDVLRRLWLWLWLLVPANPILVRVVTSASRRVRHLWLRTIYLTALLIVVLFSLFAFMAASPFPRSDTGPRLLTAYWGPRVSLCTSSSDASSL